MRPTGASSIWPRRGGLSYSKALDWLVLETYEPYKNHRVPDAARLLLPLEYPRD